MEKLNNNELVFCTGGNIVTAVTRVFMSFINMIKKCETAWRKVK